MRVAASVSQLAKGRRDFSFPFSAATVGQDQSASNRDSRWDHKPHRDESALPLNSMSLCLATELGSRNGLQVRRIDGIALEPILGLPVPESMNRPGEYRIDANPDSQTEVGPPDLASTGFCG